MTPGETRRDWRDTQFILVDDRGCVGAEEVIKGRAIGEVAKARTELGWQPTVTFGELVEMMVSAEVRRVQLASAGGGA